MEAAPPEGTEGQSLSDTLYFFFLDEFIHVKGRTAERKRFFICWSISPMVTITWAGQAKPEPWSYFWVSMGAEAEGLRSSFAAGELAQKWGSQVSSRLPCTMPMLQAAAESATPQCQPKFLYFQCLLSSPRRRAEDQEEDRTSTGDRGAAPS